MILENIKDTNLFIDILNMLLLFIVIFYISITNQVKKKYFIILSIYLLLPFLFYWLWHWTFLPDQSKYASLVYSYRNFNYDKSPFFLLSSRVDFSSLLLALFPIPFVTTIVSVALINKGILCAIVLYFLSKKKYYFLVCLLLFLPSMIVFSSVALRETLVIVLGILFFYFFIEKKNYKKSLIIGIFLVLTKPHLGIVCLGVAFIYFIFFITLDSKKINKIFFTASLVIFSLILITLSKDKLIFFRNNFILEEFGYQYFKDSNLSFSITLLLLSFIKFFFSPLSTGSINLINVVIFTENLFVIYVAILFLKLIYKENKNKVIFWIIIWSTLFIIFGFVIVNAGTIWRYKSVMQIIILFAIYFSLEKKNKIKLL